MAIQVTCDSCFFSFSVKDEHAGKKGKCPECGETVPIPGRGGRSTASTRSAAASSRSGSSSRRPAARGSSSDSNQGLIISGAIAAGVVVLGFIGFFVLRSGGNAKAPANGGQPVATNTTPTPQPPTPSVAPVAPTVAPVPTFPNSGTPTTIPTVAGTSTPVAPTEVAKPSSSATNTPAVAGSSDRKEYASVADLIDAVKPSVCRINVKLPDGTSTGSGFVVDKDGTVVTNYHVIEGSESATVVFPDDTMANVAGILALNPKMDIAVIKIDYPSSKLHPAKLATSDPRQGEVVVAIGAPLGLSFTSTKGDVSSMRKASELQQYGADVEGSWVQTSTPISPGNSGGPLFNMYGEVVAANTMSIAAKGAQNLNFGTSAENIRGMVAKKSSTLIAMTPSAAPPREGKSRGSEGDPSAVIDETKTLRGKQLLRDVKEVLMLDIDISRLNSNPRVQQFVTDQAERMWKKAGVEVVRRSDAQAFMVVIMRLKTSGASSSANTVEIQTIVMVRDKQGRRCRVYDSTDDCGTMSQIALTKGDVPANTSKKIQNFFAKIPAAMESAKTETEGKPDEDKKDKKDEKKPDSK